MLIYADSANVELLKRVDAMGVICGITTNPVILAREKEKPLNTIQKLCHEFPEYQVYAQVTGKDFREMIRRAEAYAEISEQVVIKIPACEEGMKALAEIRRKELFQNKICITTILTAGQALMAAAAGADYVAPYLGDMNGIGYAYSEVLKDIVGALKNTETQVLAAGVNTSEEMVHTAVAGADILTVAPECILSVFEKSYPMTRHYLELFENAAGK